MMKDHAASLMLLIYKVFRLSLRPRVGHGHGRPGSVGSGRVGLGRISITARFIGSSRVGSRRLNLLIYLVTVFCMNHYCCPCSRCCDKMLGKRHTAVCKGVLLIVIRWNEVTNFLIPSAGS